MTKKDMKYTNVKKIDKRTMETIRKMTARYIYIDRDGNATCESCNGVSKMTGTTHRKMAKCPECGKSLEVIHRWRKSQNESIQFGCTADAIDSSTLMMRYVLSYRIDGHVCEFEEVAREVIDFKNQNVKYYENRPKFWNSDERVWCKGTRNYFREYGMPSYAMNRWCCRGAEPTKRVLNEVKKLDVFKYFSPTPSMFKNCYVSSVLCFTSKRVGLYEKLQKIGLDTLIEKDLHTYHWDEIKYNGSKTKLTEMLGISKMQLGVLKSSPTLDSLRTLQDMGNIDNEKIVQFIIDNKLSNVRELEEFDLLKMKVLRYIAKNTTVREYAHYVSLLKKMEYPLDDNYLYPKDFKKMDNLIAKEYADNGDAIRNRIIKKISDGLKKLDNIQELLNGSKGFLVYIPESQKDLNYESTHLHNCIRGYGDRIADGKTLLFFIRRLEAPNTPFVAMEYYNGEILQCRYDNNVDVKTSGKEDSDKVIEFAEAIRCVLVENKVMVA